MKTNIKLGKTLIKANVRGTTVESDKVEFLLDFDSRLTIFKDQVPPENFDNFANFLNTVNVTSEGVYNLDVFTGKVTVNNTEKAQREFNEVVNAGIQNVTSAQSSKPLIEGVFTQEATGAHTVSQERLKELAEKLKNQKSKE